MAQLGSYGHRMQHTKVRVSPFLSTSGISRIPGSRFCGQWDWLVWGVDADKNSISGRSGRVQAESVQAAAGEILSRDDII